MEEPKKLVPRTVHLSSDKKSIRLDQESSDGTKIGITYDVPEGIEWNELRILVLREHQKLHAYTLFNEHMKGTVRESDYNARQGRIREMFTDIIEKWKAKLIGKPSAEIADEGAEGG